MLLKKWEQDLEKSQKIFSENVIPVLKTMGFDGEYLPIEKVHPNELEKSFDAYAGIDIWFVKLEIGMRGIASRIQTIRNGYRPYNTFTIRLKRCTGSKTEFEKRLYAIENKWLYPFYTLQAYVKEETKEVLSVAICKTEELYRIAEAQKELNIKVNSEDSNQFIFINWDEFNEDDIRIWQNPFLAEAIKA
jgi:hypothetical protein